MGSSKTVSGLGHVSSGVLAEGQQSLHMAQVMCGGLLKVQLYKLM